MSAQKIPHRLHIRHHLPEKRIVRLAGIPGHPNVLPDFSRKTEAYQGTEDRGQRTERPAGAGLCGRWSVVGGLLRM
jgi:hypothetical protein